jgi:hypothetical protein
MLLPFDNLKYQHHHVMCSIYFVVSVCTVAPVIFCFAFSASFSMAFEIIISMHIFDLWTVQLRSSTLYINEKVQA